MPLIRLVRYGSMAALLAGVLRVFSSFVPYNSGSVLLECLYFLIDVCLLLGLLSIYLYQHEHLGRTGFAGFLVAFIGTASIVGPDGKLGSVDMYVAGSLAISLGLTVLGVAVWRARRLPRAVAALWWLSTLLGVGGFVISGPAAMLVAAGVAFGLAFVIAGTRIMTDTAYR